VSVTLSSGEVTVEHRYRVRNAEGEWQGLVVTTGPRGAVTLPVAPAPAAV